MANCSDAFGTITVKEAGQEFLDFLEATHGDEPWYKLVEQNQYEDVEPDEDNNLTIHFSTFGRWCYKSNIDGYLAGEWLKGDPAYEKFVTALQYNGGVVTVDYTDSDVAMDWMGKGVYTMSAKGGEVEFKEVFKEQVFTVKGYCELMKLDEHDAIERLYGENISNAYSAYVHRRMKGGKKALEFDDWFTEEEV